MTKPRPVGPVAMRQPLGKVRHHRARTASGSPLTIRAMAGGSRSSTVLTSWTSALLRTLGALGIDAAALAERAGLMPADLDDPDRRIPLAASTQLWTTAVEATGDPALGLVVSLHVRPGTFHTLGHAVLASSTLRDALERVARFCNVTADAARVTIAETAAEVSLTVAWRHDTEPPAPEAIDAIMASLVRSARFMLDRSVAPSRISLERPEPPDRAPFDRVFRCPIAFAAPANCVTFDRATAERRVAGGHAPLAELHDRVTAAYLAGLDASTTAERVRQVLPDLLPAGEPSISAAAAVLAVSPRTLQRQLHEEQTTFRAVLADTRRRLAIDYLRAGEHSITEITYLLGFSETPTFSRAFRQWTGVAPSQFT
ncbi:MAG: transcriptional regulator, AraC family [Acidimicrobiales bacterium]|nr:transcriptional regulator, AraC family [Acidimicrobiales bacterium]